MGRTILAVIGGMFAGGITVGVVESIGHALFPPPISIDPNSPEAMKLLMSHIPLGAKIAVVIAWALGSLVAGAVAAPIARTQGTIAALAAGACLLAAGIWSLVTIPHPAWMAALGVILPLPMAWLGSRLASR